MTLAQFGSNQFQRVWVSFICPLNQQQLITFGRESKSLVLKEHTLRDQPPSVESALVLRSTRKQQIGTVDCGLSSPGSPGEKTGFLNRIP